MPSLELKVLTKTFPATVAVDHLSLSIRDGELLAVVGPSGCGKTTLLRLVSGLERTSSGSIHIGPRDVTADSPRSRNVAMVFQDAAIFPQFNVGRNLTFGPRLRRVSREDARHRAEGVAQTLGVADLLPRQPAQLSGGQRQRVALGRAIVRQPQLLLLDEPLSQLDEPLRDQLRQEIRRVQQSLGLTTIYVTHDQAEALQLGQRVLVMRAGRLQQLGTPQEIYERPANRFVAEFIGSPPMNVISCAKQPDGLALRFAIGEQDSEQTFELPAAVGGRFRELPARFHIGFRPESVRLFDDVGGHDKSHFVFAANVSSVTWLGDHQLVQFGTSGKPLAMAKLPTDAAITAEQSLRLAVAASALHFFATDGDRQRL